MAEIILWNSIARRRRSMSDTFYDNGLGTLQSYLEQRGHKVIVEDWAQDGVFQSFSPLFLSFILRKFYRLLFAVKNKTYKKILGIFSFFLQDILGIIQEFRFRRKVVKYVKSLQKKGVKIIGIKAWYGEAFIHASYFARQVKKFLPQTITIIGGYHETLYEEHLLKDGVFDFGAVCEGEYPLEEILKIIDNYKEHWDKQMVIKKIVEQAQSGKIENFLYAKDGNICKTERRKFSPKSKKSIPRYTLNPNKIRIHVMVESIGCDWGKCNFCVHPHFYPNYALRDPDDIIQEIKTMVKLGIGIFRFAGSDTPPVFGAKIAEKILASNLSVVFGMGSRAIRNAKDKKTMLIDCYTKLIKAGLRAVFMGGECGNDFINQEVMNKGVVYEDIVSSIASLREAEKIAKAKVFLSLALIYPPPLLGKVSLKQVWEDNKRLLEDTCPDSVMITPPGPFLHTRWYKEKEKFGFKIQRGFLERAMRYEYVLYKPPDMWPDIGLCLDNKPFSQILKECNEFRNFVEQELVIPTDISDEHFLMFYGAGIKEKYQLIKAKKETMLDIISCDYRYIHSLAEKANQFSEKLALQNL